MRRVHVIGAGLAGLSAALHLAKSGAVVTLHEAAPHAGGRCRSFVDPVLGCTIDNGAHLMLSGNGEVAAYLDAIGASHAMQTASRARFDFFDGQSNQRWALDLGYGQGLLSVLQAVLRRSHRPPGVSAWTLFKDLTALKSGQRETVASCVGASPALQPFWEPLTVAVLNAHPDEAAAALLWRVVAETALKGGAYARPMTARQGLGPALIDPALDTLRRLGVTVRLGQRVQSLEFSGGRITGLNFADAAEVLADTDHAVLAVAHFAAQDLLPGLSVPGDSRAILNVHFKLPEAHPTPSMTGLVNSDAQWVFVRDAVASVTVSAADAWMDQDAEAIAHALWPDVAKVLGLASEMVAHRVIKERRATFGQTPEALALRPSTRTAYANLFLAGDWTDTGLPATIEGALKSGRMAAQAVQDA